MQFAMPAASAEKCCPVARLLGWDTLRGLAAFLVVMLHAGVPYMVSPFPHLVWPARDADPSMTVDAVVWCAECFIMPLFFVMGGFFSQGLLSSRGERKFLVGRTKRLLLTQLAAGIVILPACLLIWTLGWMGDGILSPSQVLQLGFPADIWNDLWGNSHLWFLQHLYIYCLGLCGISWLRKKLRSANCSEPIRHPRFVCCIDGILGSVWKPLLPAIPCAAILYYDPRIVLGFYQTFHPVLSKLAYYWIYFFVGACIYRHRTKLHLHARYGWSYLILSGLIFSVTLPLIREHLGPHATGENRLLLAGLLSLFAWVTTFGLLAVFLNLQLNTRVTRYFAEASFWVYLIHLPLVVLAQIAIVQLPVVTVGKYGIVFVVTMFLSLASYQVFVRNRWLGEFLNGQCRVKVPQLSSPAVLAAQPILAVTLPLQPAIDRKKAG
jgi:glucan biosynthesis protein C